MQNERENLYQPLEYVEYDISGNVFRAYYDADGKIVFVLDFTESSVKPNVLLVINPVGDRKWDDILANDYGVDLESVRPKKDNKYQKLDIEYTGLAEYDNLIQAKQSGDDISGALQQLAVFHNDAARRAAYERLGMAEIQAENARETIEKTRVTISELQTRLKMLRTKLAAQRREIGREPTKQSAAKILRTETQIDAANDKLTRAKKRLQKAQRRLSGAEDDIEVANSILALLENDDFADAVNLPTEPAPTDMVEFNPVFADDEEAEVGDDFADAVNLPAEPAPTDMVEFNPVFADDEDAEVIKASEEDNNKDLLMQSVGGMPTNVINFAPVFAQNEIEEKNNLEQLEPKAEEMADEEVKPLFDTDPKILDEEIAFKPVSFGAPVIEEEVDLPAVIEDEPLPMPMPMPMPAESEVAVAPVLSVPEQVPEVTGVEPETDDATLTFVPPLMSEEVADEAQVVPPVLDTITSVSEPDVQIDAELMPSIEIPQITEEQLSQPAEQSYTESTTVEPVVEDYSNQVSTAVEEQPEIQSMSEIEPAPIDTGMRPVSPISGEQPETVDSASVAVVRQKPTLLYYVLLFGLIVLSIFTLWFYQNSANKKMPELGVETVQEVIAVEEEKTVPAPEVQQTDEVVQQDVVVEEKEVAEQPVVLNEEVVVETVSVEVEPVSVEVEPEPVPVVAPEPIQVVPTVEPEPVPVSKLIDDAIAKSEVPEPTIAPAYVESPFFADDEKPKKKIQTEEEILARKPAYGVSQNEKMFVADEEYETDTSVVVDETEVFEDVYEATDDVQIIRPQSQMADDALSDAEYQLVTQEIFEETETVDTCADGNAPDIDGCCAGEELRDLDGDYMCCAIGTDDCFPPMM